MIGLGLLEARERLDFPAGDNSSDTVFGNVHFNVSTLQHWNYTYYSNHTLSNESHCYLTFEPYQPHLLYTNGTFVNATSCYSAINPIGTRGFVGIAFAVLYGIALMLTMPALAKHGRLHLPKERRFYPIGRRWQWYWACFVCACGLISLFTNIDVDRYYLQELPLILAVFFWFLLCQGTLALTWEAVRHWGSWLERQYIDPNPFILQDGDKRATIEFWLPLWFYFWVWMNFFLVVPRNWNFVTNQRSPEQTATVAKPAATDGRFKAGAFCLIIAWLTICFSLRHSIQHYKPRNRGIYNRVTGLIKAIPLRFMLTVPLTLALVIYQTLIAFDWSLSLLRLGGVVPAIFAWGYGPSLLVLYVQIVYGYVSPNEDKELIRQRAQRGEQVDRELGIVRKPAWWRRVRGDHMEGTLRDKILRNVQEVGGERGIGRRAEADLERHVRLEAERSAVSGDGGIELDRVGRRNGDSFRQKAEGVNSQVNEAYPWGGRQAGKSERHQTGQLMQTAAGIKLSSKEAEAERARRVAELMEDGPLPSSDVQRRRSSAGRRGSESTANSTDAPPQQIRSMLDI